jgi:SAM-dependent methyltransferase
MTGVLRRRLASYRYKPVLAPPFQPGGSPESTDHTRAVIAAIYLRGDGIEIGALHHPLPLPSGARARYVDRMSVPDLRRHYHELAHENLVEADIIDNGETLALIGDRTQDFVIANHFIEHCQNPIDALRNMLRVLKPGGILYLGVPDKRHTFDAGRPSTPLEHVMRDFADGPEWSRRDHYEEWSRVINKRVNETDVHADVTHMLQIDYSIHFHVWQASDLLDLLAAVRKLAPFELEVFLRNGFETLVVLRAPCLQTQS